MGALLQTTAVNKQFGGLSAVTDLNISINAGEIVGLIGPNGAGKTTSFNLITGVYVPTSGTVTFAGEDITGMKPHRIARLGVARTFQNIRLFREMSVLENVMVAQHMRMGANLLEATLRLPSYLRKERLQLARASRCRPSARTTSVYRRWASSYLLAHTRRCGILRPTRQIAFGLPGCGIDPPAWRALARRAAHPRP